MDDIRSRSKSQKKKSSVSDNAKREARAKTLRRCEAIAMKSSGRACKAFAALKFHADIDGHCWLMISTLQNSICVKRRETISRAFRELENLGVLDRARLVSKSNGCRGPNLYRIGGKIEGLPSKAAARFILHAIDGEKWKAT
jgi:hypothetical protein